MRAKFGMILAGLTLSLSTACVSGLVMDTGRALPKGESTWTVGAAAGWREGEPIAYEKPTYAPLPESNEPSGLIGEGRQWPLWNFQAEWGARYSYGLGAGLQTDILVTAPTPVGLGAGVGTTRCTQARTIGDSFNGAASMRMRRAFVPNSNVLLFSLSFNGAASMRMRRGVYEGGPAE